MFILGRFCGNFSRLCGKFNNWSFGFYIGSWSRLFVRTQNYFKRQNFFMWKLATVKFDMCILSEFSLCNIECTVYILLVAILSSISGERGMFKIPTRGIWPKVIWYGVWLTISWLIFVLISHGKIFHPTKQACELLSFIQAKQFPPMASYVRLVPPFHSEQRG